MFDKEEQQLHEMRSKLEELPIPTEQLNDAIQQGILIADDEWRTKRQKRRKSLWTLVVAAIFLVTFVTSIRVSPAFANAVASIPGMGKIVEYIQFDKGLQGIMDNEYYQSLHASQVKDDMTLTINGVILDESGVVISYTLEAPYSIEELKYKEIKLYHKGKEIPLGAMTYNNPNQPHKNRKEDLIQIGFSDKQSFEGREFVLELQLELADAKETIFTLPFELPDEVKKAKVYTLNKEIEIENQKMTIQDITIYPLRVAIKIIFDDANTMKILHLEDIRIEDDKGEVWSGIRNGMSVGGLGEERIYYLQSNYFEKPGKLYLKMNKIQALPKEESYLLVDLAKQQVLKQPSARKIEVTEITANRIEAGFETEEHFGYSLFFDTINKDGEPVEYVSQSSGSYENYAYSTITFKEQQEKNPLRINFSAYPNYIHGDISIELD